MCGILRDKGKKAISLVFPFFSNLIARLRPSGDSSYERHTGVHHMYDEVIHLKERHKTTAYCGTNLYAWFPDSYIEGYDPERKRYAVLRVVYVSEYHPVIEQVGITEVEELCPSCLSDYGMRLLFLYKAKDEDSHINY